MKTGFSDAKVKAIGPALNLVFALVIVYVYMPAAVAAVHEGSKN